MIFLFFGDILKKFFFLFITLLLIIIIYSNNYSKRVNYVSLSDSIFNSSLNYYNYNDYVKEKLVKKNRLGSYDNIFNNHSILGIYKDINNNRTIRLNGEDHYLKKVLRESNFIVLSIGMEELALHYDSIDMKKNEKFFQKMYSNLELLLTEINKYAYGNIIFLGYYNPTNNYNALTDAFFYNINIKLNRLMMSHGIIYIDLYELVKGNDYKIDNVRLNSKAYEKISKIIWFYIENML